MKTGNIVTWLGIILLTTLEQTIKIIINNRFLNSNIPILPPVLYFKPMFNRDYSWFNSMLKLGIGKWFHIAVVIIMILVIYRFYIYLNKYMGRNTVIDILFIFVFSGAMCSMIDKIFWNGSLDYILVNGFFTFDLKDVYVNITIGLLLFFSLIRDRALESIDGKMLKDFLKFILPKSKVR